MWLTSGHVTILGDFSHKLFMLHVWDVEADIFEYTKTVHCSCDWANGLLYRDSQKLCVRLQIGAGICTVLTADAVVTGKGNS